MNSNMNDHAEKLKKRIKICKNEENKCKEIVESARSRHKMVIQNLEREKTNLDIANVKLKKMMDYLKQSPKKDNFNILHRSNSVCVRITSNISRKQSLC